MEKIILCTDGSTFSETNYQYGAWFAQQCHAPIEVLYLSERRHAQRKLKNLSGSIGFNASESLLKRIVQVEHDYAKLEQEKSKEILCHAQKVFESKGLIENTYVHHEGDLVEDLQQEEEQAGLIILGKCGGSTGVNAEPHLGAHVERIMRSLHTPCLITCKQYQPIHQVLLAYDASSPCQKAFAKLIELPFMSNHPLHIVQVMKQEDLQTMSHLKELQARAKAANIDTRIKLLTGHIEDTLQNYITKNDISLLVMGIHGNRPIRNLIMGHTATHMLEETKIPVLLYR